FGGREEVRRTDLRYVGTGENLLPHGISAIGPGRKLICLPHFCHKIDTNSIHFQGDFSETCGL
ncbi:hypothetical protein, partial [Bacillus licheniformis]|uniref:hypothetical protein n=1 Tax=Bacillus licheniformis TaxID=1402 RepID=UPI001C8A301B